MTKQNKSQTKKKSYQKPQLKKWGSLKDLTQSMSASGGPDPTTPGTKMMCLSVPAEIEEHRLLVGDPVSNRGLRDQIEAIVEPGDRVVDIGAGTGILSFFAVEAGASHVDAVEMRPIVNLARAAADQNGFGDKITFHGTDSEKLELAQKADVLISNLGFLNTLLSLPDAIERLLKPGGKYFPTAIQLEFAPIDVKGVQTPSIQFWKEQHHGYDLSAFMSMAQHPYYQTFEPETFLGDTLAVEPVEVTANLPSFFEWSFTSKITKRGTLAGLAGYYNYFRDEVCYINQTPPNDLERSIWGGFVLPLVSQVEVKPGDVMNVSLEFHLADNAVWRWKIELNGKLLGDHSNIGSVWPVS
jgi:2-polyprenyl-3-methyl-5-hydroxy-6-metoxy-1,4-benzoquinol methylase